MKICSYSLFRAPSPVYWRSDATDDRLSAYARFLPALVRAHHALWSGYELRIHHDDAAESHPYFPALRAMHERGLLRLMPCGPVPALCLAMLWRLKPLFDPDDHVVISCDLDSLPLLRLRRMVDEFAESGKAAMLVHACESHDGVMGGGLAGRGFAFRQRVGCATWDDLVALAGPVNWQEYSSDEHFQRVKLWPLIEPSAIIFRDVSEPPTIPCSDLRRLPSGDAVPEGVLPEAAERGDHFAPYIGSAGYALMEAFMFYQALPLPVMQSIRECEGESLDLNRVMNP